MVPRDSDSSDCRVAKRKLSDICEASGHKNWLVRIACAELESWYPGDLAAVEQGLRLDGLNRLQTKSGFRNPDTLQNASDELTRLTNHKYGKISGSRNIGPHLSTDSNRSHSLNIFLCAVRYAISHLSRA